jgi:hypothetical protein
MPASRISAALAIALICGLAGCGDDDSSNPEPTGPLAEALASVGGGGANGSLGVGWADPQLVEESGGGVRLIAEALGPNAGSVVESGTRLRRRFGLDPQSAEQLVSVGGSYAFGLRLDGVDGRELGRALVAAGGQARKASEVDLVQIGDYAVVPQPLLSSGVNGLGAFDAIGRELTILAISDRARDTLLGRGDRLLDEPTYRAAADCLEDVVAVRMIPDKLLLSTEQGVDLLALGITADGNEVLCVLGGTPERADDIASALETSLAPDARDPVSRAPIGDSVASVQVAADGYEGVEEVRAELTLAKGQAPGFLFGAVARGSLVGLINGIAQPFPGESEG